MEKIKHLNIFSFFSGAGFLDLGFELSGYKIVSVNEIQKTFLDAYRYSRKHLKLPEPEYGYFEGDISCFLDQINSLFLSHKMNDLKRRNGIVGFIGGPPCPDFSVGGKNRGRNGENGKLSGIYVEIICQQKPDFFLFENVKGLWQTKRHRAFYEEIKRKTQKAGFITTEKLVNSIESGVPQDRDRIILIGFNKKLLSDLGAKFNVHSELPEGLFPWSKHLKYSKDKAFSYPWPKTSTFKEDSAITCSDKIPRELTVEFWFEKNEVLNHTNAEHFFKPRAGIKRFETIAEGDDSRKSFKRLHRWRYSPTACYGHNEVHLHPYKIRRISVAEALAIQSLPKEYNLPPNISLTDMFKIIGNGVPYLTSRALALTIKNFMGTPV